MSVLAESSNPQPLSGHGVVQTVESDHGQTSEEPAR